MQRAHRLPVIVSGNLSVCRAFSYQDLINFGEPVNMKSGIN